MNTWNKKHRLIPMLLTLSPLLLFAPSAQAISTFNSSAALTYTINSIANLDNPGDLTSLNVTGSFELASPPDYSVTVTGDGSVNGTNPSLGPVPVANVFSKTVAVSGSVSGGTLNSSHLGLYGLSFDNTGNDSYSISLTLSYQLDTAVHGPSANSEIWLDFYNEAYTFSGSEHILASVFSAASGNQSGSSGPFNFTLGPGGSEALYADVRITGNLEASPVPLPAGAWLMLAGLSTITAIGKCQRIRA